MTGTIVIDMITKIRYIWILYVYLFSFLFYGEVFSDFGILFTNVPTPLPAKKTS